MIINKIGFFYKSLFLGLITFCLPIICFLSENNLKFLSSEDLKLIILSELILLFLLVLTGAIIYKFFLKYLNKKLNIFFYLAIYYIFLHFYKGIKSFLTKYINNDVNIENFLNDNSELSLIFITIFFIIFVYVHLIFENFSKFINRTFVLIITLNIIYFQFPNFKNLFMDSQKSLELNDKYYSKIDNELDFKKINNLKKINNVYYIILDGMMPLDLAEKQSIIKSEKNFIEKFKDKKFKYIKNSISTYNFTHTTLASIWNIDYLDENLSLDYNYEGFPKNLWKSLKKEYLIPLEYILSKANVDFYWLGNVIMYCQDGKNKSLYNRDAYWKCIDESRTSTITQLASTRFETTPFNDILIKFLNLNEKIRGEETKGQKNLSKYITRYHNKLNNENPRFIFIHNMSPHWPFSLNSDCSKRQYKEWAPVINQYEGYKESYLCMLKEINMFIDFINQNDPESVVVIQADHGWNIRYEDYKMKRNQVSERAQIFNLIKAPNKCFNYKARLKNNVNTIRFVLNCIFNEDLEYRENIHYEKMWGREYEHIPKNEKKVHTHLFN